jgi:hypothetical protein
MTATRVRWIGAAALLVLALVGVRWLVTRRAAPPEPTPAATVEDTVAAPDELERLRAEIEAQRAAEARARGEAIVARLSVATFSHAQHRDVACVQCHDITETHGRLTVTDLRQCRDCHHAQPLAANCARCHRESEFAGERRRMPQTFSTTVAPPVTREILFAHVQHRTVACVSCHREPVSLRVTVSCDDCHRDHHEPRMQCMACHIAPPRAAHTVQAHLGCTGSGCHDPAPIAGVPRTRTLCLVCHQELVDHERGGSCADCHLLPPPRAAALVSTPAREELA